MPAAPGLSVEVEGGVPFTLRPEESREVRFRWTPTTGRARQVFGHVVVRSNDRANGVAAVAVHTRGNLVKDHVLSIITFFPLVGLLLIFILHLQGTQNDEYVRWIALVSAAVPLVVGAYVWSGFNPLFGRGDGNAGMQFVEHGVWVPGFNIEYYVGVDGVSISMVLLTVLISFIGVIVSWGIEKGVKGYFAMYLLLETGMLGTFVALDFFLFFVFWEVMLLPMYFLIGIWGGPRKEYAAIKFFLYTLAGSVLMLLAMIALYYHSDPSFLVDGTYAPHTFSLTEMMANDYAGKQLTLLGMPFTKVLWVFLFIGFAIKVPMFPFHTWLPDAHVEAPTAISVILAGVLLKMGIYGMFRMNFAILPDATIWGAQAMAVFGVINIVYGAFCAMAQEDLKKLVAYSSVSHMGFCLLGMSALTPQGMNGAMFQMFNHGTITAMLFTLVGVVYDRVHTRDISKFGGLASEMPVYTAFVGLAFMASLGLPGLSGFVSEALCFLGAFPVWQKLTIIAASGVVVTAAYHLWALQRVFLGKFNIAWRSSKYLEPYGGKFPEITLREAVSLAPLAIIVLVLGFYPSAILDLISTGMADLKDLVQPTEVMQAARHVTDTAAALASLQ
jgi:NADH-quinone oxidoreductase subunit M